NRVLAPGEHVEERVRVHPAPAATATAAAGTTRAAKATRTGALGQGHGADQDQRDEPQQAQAKTCDSHGGTLKVGQRLPLQPGKVRNFIPYLNTGTPASSHHSHRFFTIWRTALGRSGFPAPCSGPAGGSAGCAAPAR